MKRAVIFGAAPAEDWSYIRPYLRKGDMIICADGGQHAVQQLGLTADWYVGDSDSGGCAGNLPADILPSEKDVTDLDMAVSRALNEGCDFLLLCGCTGGREDHHLSAIGQLERIFHAGREGIIIDPQNEIRLLRPGCTIVPVQPGYSYFGIIPLDAVLRSVSIRGAKYEVENTDFYRWSSLGISNEPVVGQICEISVREGVGLLIRSNEMHK